MGHGIRAYTKKVDTSSDDYDRIAFAYLRRGVRWDSKLILEPYEVLEAVYCNGGYSGNGTIKEYTYEQINSAVEKVESTTQTEDLYRFLQKCLFRFSNRVQIIYIEFG